MKQKTSWHGPKTLGDYLGRLGREGNSSVQLTRREQPSWDLVVVVTFSTVMLTPLACSWFRMSVVDWATAAFVTRLAVSTKPATQKLTNPMMLCCFRWGPQSSVSEEAELLAEKQIRKIQLRINVVGVDVLRRNFSRPQRGSMLSAKLLHVPRYARSKNHRAWRKSLN